MRFAAAALLVMAACHEDLGDVDSIFYAGGVRPVHCAVDIDSSAENGESSIDSGLDRARDRGEVIEIYAHEPGGTVPVATVEHVLAGARDRGLGFYTYDDFAAGVDVGAGIALSFDDQYITEWTALRPMLQAYGARVTFFVSRYRELFDDTARAELHDLAGDGHAIAAHTVLHLRAPDYVERHGVAQYLSDEVVPSIEALEEDGFAVHAFAYPFGVRTGEIDRAIEEHVPVLRSVSYPWEPVASPCPL